MRDTAINHAAVLDRQKLIDRLFFWSTFAVAILVLLILAGIIITLVVEAWPAVDKFGIRFLVTQSWNPPKEDFGALQSIYGTLVTSGIAMLFGIPISFGIAIFIAELCPAWFRNPLAITIELLAGIPSIIYGIWGLFIFAPFLHDTIYPVLLSTIGWVPVIGALFAGTPNGSSMLTAGLVLAIMVLPFISSIMRDIFMTVPPMLRESAYGIGCTTWEVTWKVILPYTRVSIVGGIMLGLGRALGETMAVTFVIGNVQRIAISLFQPGTTISATLASEFNEAEGIHIAALMYLGLILFCITFTVLALAKLMLWHTNRLGEK